MSDAVLICFSFITVGALVIWAYLYNAKSLEFSRMEQIKLKGEIDEKLNKQNWEQKQSLKMMERQKYYDLEKMRLELQASQRNSESFEDMLPLLEMFNNKSASIEKVPDKNSIDGMLQKFGNMSLDDLAKKYPELYDMIMSKIDVKDGEIVK